MTSYVVTGHPLNLSNLGPAADAVRVTLQSGVGTTVNLTLSGPDDAKVKSHGCLK